MKKSQTKKKQSKFEQIYSQPMRFTQANTAISQPSELIQSLQIQLEQEWKSKNIPFPLCEIYSHFLSTLPQRKTIIFIQKEIADLRSYSSLVQICLKGITAREESLLSIKDMSDYLSKSSNWNSLVDIRIECAEILHAHRMLTLNVAESIERWKELFSYESSDFIANFMYNGENYLLKMRKDLDFISTSELSKAFDFSPESDPLLIFPSKLVEKHKPKLGNNYFIYNGQVIIPLPTILLKRVQKMDQFLRDEENLCKEVSNTRVLGSKGLISLEDFKQQIEKVAKSVAEKIYRELIHTQAYIVVIDQVNEFIARMISLNLDSVIDPLLEEIVTGVLKNRGKNEIGNKIEKNFVVSQSENLESRKNFTGDEVTEKLVKGNKEEQKDDQSEKVLEQKNKGKDFEKLVSEKDQYREIPQTELSGIKNLTNKTRDSPQNPFEPVENSENISTEINIDSYRRSSINAQNLQNFTAIEWYLRQLIEDLIKEADLESLANHCIHQILTHRSKTANLEEKRKLTQILQNLENEKLQETLFFSILDSFVQQDWIETLASSLIEIVRNPERRKTFEPLKIDKPELVVEEAEDYALEVFTPGVHSPNEVLSETEKEDELVSMSHTSEMLNRVISEGKSANCELVPFGESFKMACRSLEEYLKSLQGWEKVFFGVDELKKVILYCEDPAWYWLKDGNEFVGCLIFSSFVWEKNRTALVHHFSTVNPEQIQVLLKKSQILLGDLLFKSILFNTDPSQLKIVVSALKLPNYKTVNLHFPWSEKSEKILFLDLPDNFLYNDLPLTFSLKILSSNSVTIKEESIENNKKPDPAMMVVGTRHCILDSLLKLANEHSINLISDQIPSIRLQRDIFEILEIVSSLDDFEFPFIRAEKTEISTYKSSLDLNFSFPNITSFPYTHNSRTYKFITLLNTQQYKSDQYTLYELSTTTSELSAFFLYYPNLSKELQTELKGFKSDLFNKIDNILKTLPANYTFSEVSLPAFSLSLNWNVPWMQGFELTPNTFVSNCSEIFDLKMNFPQQASGLLNPLNTQFITNDFVFGLRHKTLDSMLEVPLLVCLIQEHDWLVCN